MIVMAIIGTLSAMAVPTFQGFADKTRAARAIADIKAISAAIEAYKIAGDPLPMSLAAVGYGSQLDPWGRPYQYLNLEATRGVGAARKDHFLVPLNSDFDLYSLGKDGESQPPLTAKASRDDIVRANNGGFIGLASLY
jgi:general secretion pathway protein G